jgi:hypothetical protein
MVVSWGSLCLGHRETHSVGSQASSQEDFLYPSTFDSEIQQCPGIDVSSELPCTPRSRLAFGLVVLGWSL